MCCFKRPKRIGRKYKRKSIVCPEPEDKKENEGVQRRRRNAVDAEFMDLFIKEVIYCGGCKKPFNLDSNQLKIHCNICNQFFHCNIAGECMGEDCKILQENGEIDRAKYCIKCVKMINKNNTCICLDCY